MTTASGASDAGGASSSAAVSAARVIVRLATRSRDFVLPSQEEMVDIAAPAAVHRAYAEELARALAERLAGADSRPPNSIYKTLLLIEHLVRKGPQLAFNALQEHTDAVSGCLQYRLPEDPSTTEDPASMRDQFHPVNIREKAEELCRLLSPDRARSPDSEATRISDTSPEQPSGHVPASETTTGQAGVHLFEYRRDFPDFDITNKIIKHESGPTKSTGFSDVRQGTLDRSATVALKFFRVGARDLDRAARSHKHEVSLWRQMKHENVLPLLGLYWDTGYALPALVSPWCQNGNVRDYLEVRQADPKTEQTELDALKLRLLDEVLAAIRYLHEYTTKLVHGDIKSDNVFVTDDEHARLGDYGLAVVVSDTMTRPSVARGTMAFMAPEQHREERSVPTCHSDIWAFGCLACEVQYNCRPYDGSPSNAAIVKKVIQDVPIWLGDRVPDRLWWLMLQTWELTPQKRPTAKQLQGELQRLRKAQADDPSGWRSTTLPAEDQVLFSLPAAKRALGIQADPLFDKQRPLQRVPSKEAHTNAAIQALLIVLNPMTEDGGKWIRSRQNAESIRDIILQILVEGTRDDTSLDPKLFALFADSAMVYLSIWKNQFRNWENALIPAVRLRRLVGYLETHHPEHAKNAKLWFGSALTAPQLEGHTAQVTCIQFNADGQRLVSGAEDGNLCVWDTSSACDGAPLRTINAHDGGVRLLAVSADGSRAVSAATNARVWDLAAGSPASAPLCCKHAVGCIAITRDGSRAAYTDHKRPLVYVWAAETGAVPIMRTGGHLIHALAFADDDPARMRVLCGNKTHELTKEGLGPAVSLMLPDKPAPDSQHGCVFGPGGALVGHCGGGVAMRVVDAVTGVLAAGLRPDTATFDAPEEGCEDGSTRGAQAKAKKKAKAVKSGTAPCLLALSPCGGWALGSFFGTLVVSNTLPGERASRGFVYESKWTHTAIALSPGGRTAATVRTGGKVIRLWGLSNE